MQVIMGITTAMIAAPIFAIFVRSFPAEIRYSGVSFTFNVGMSLFGGTAPMMATLIIGFTNNNALPSLYIIASSLIGFFVLKGLNKKRVMASKELRIQSSLHLRRTS